MAIVLAVITLLAVVVIGTGLRRLRASVAAGVTGSGLVRSAAMVFGGVAAAAIGLAVVPFTFSGHVGDGAALAVAALQTLLILGAFAAGVLMSRRVAAGPA